MEVGVDWAGKVDYKGQYINKPVHGKKSFRLQQELRLGLLGEPTNLLVFLS